MRDSLDHSGPLMDRSAQPPAPFVSVLFDGDPDGRVEADGEPDFFGDLNLDQIVASITQGLEEYDLAPLFHRPLDTVAAVRYRHHVLIDLATPGVLDAVRVFADAMREVRAQLALIGKLHHALQQQRWFVSAIEVYCAAVAAFAARLNALELGSPGLRGWRAYLDGYTRSETFETLRADTRERTGELEMVSYAVHIRGSRIRVAPVEDAPDLTGEVQEAFAKFQQGVVKDYRVGYREHPEMNHVETQILDRVARLHPDTFTALGAYCAAHAAALDPTITRFDREIQFYVAYLDHIAPLQQRGLTCSVPRVSGRSKEEQGDATFDLALAAKLAAAGQTVVTNDFRLAGPERILVISGPNNGGKTTFARTFGQLHHLAGLGLPVPGRDVRLFLADRIFTHFEREEDMTTLRGKFEDELVRIRAILEQATRDSVLIMNESFGSTTLEDAVAVGTAIVRRLIERDLLAVFVTFIDELSTLGDSTVSMVSTVAAEDPAVRTFRIVRRPADGLAYAAALAEKHGLTDAALRRRLAR